MAATYPPSPSRSLSSSSSSSFSTRKPHVSIEARYISRTPSPTPSEAQMLSHKGLNGPLNLKQYLHKKYIPQLILVAIACILIFLEIVFNDELVMWLKPLGDKLKSSPAGWLAPIAILILLSFPPLFGHEIIAVIVGVIWGIGAGFGIVSAGTLLGELANFFVFRYFFRARATKYEQKNLKYGLLAQVVRGGGFRLALMMRLSAIPPHFTTLVFTLSGMPFFVYFTAALLSLPRQLGTVVIGGMAARGGKPPIYIKVISWLIIIITVIVTIYAMRYVNRHIDAAKPGFIRARQKTRQAGMQASETASESDQSTVDSQLDLILAPRPHRPTGLTIFISSPVRPKQSFNAHASQRYSAPSIFPQQSFKLAPLSYYDPPRDPEEALGA